MKRVVEDSYCIEQETYTIEIYYRYYSDTGNWEQSPEEDIEIKKVEYNGIDITDMYFDLMKTDPIEEELIEQVRNN